MLDLKTLMIQLYDEDYGSLGENFIMGKEYVFLDLRVDAGKYSLFSSKLQSA